MNTGFPKMYVLFQFYNQNHQALQITIKEQSGPSTFYIHLLLEP